MDEYKQVAEVFNRYDVVEYYDVLATQFGLTNVEQQLIDRYFTPSDTVLVGGCGTGREAFPLHKQGYRVVGLDIAWEMLRRANGKRNALQTRHLGFSQGDVVRMPYQENSFDHVLMLSQTIQHIPKHKRRQQAFREIWRVLKTGGYVETKKMLLLK